MARNKQDAAKSKQLSESLVPGTNVIARVKGYPAWPAMVVDANDVPASVRKAKPGKKVVIPVLFYNDNSFLWIAPQEAEILSKDEAKKNANSKIKRTLKVAYSMAANPPAYKKLVAIASGTEDAEPVAEPAKAERNTKSEPVAAPSKESPRGRRARPAAELAKDQPAPRSRTAANSKKRARDEKPASQTARSKKSKTADVEVTATEAEEDSEYVDNGTEETEASTSQAETDSFDAESLANSQAARYNLCSTVRQTVQEILLSNAKLNGSKTVKVEEALAQLDLIPDLEISVARRSKLVRVVFYVLGSGSQLPDSLKAKLEAWAERWDTKAEPIIRGIPEELAPKEETEEPEDYNASIDPSRETTEAPDSRLGDEPVLSEVVKAETPQQENGTVNGSEAPSEDQGTIGQSLAADPESEPPQDQREEAQGPNTATPGETES